MAGDKRLEGWSAGSPSGVGNLAELLAEPRAGALALTGIVGLVAAYYVLERT